MCEKKSLRLAHGSADDTPLQVLRKRWLRTRGGGYCMKSNWRTRLIHSQVKVPGGFRSLVTPVFRGSTTLFSRAASIIDTWNHDDVPYTYGSHLKVLKTPFQAHQANAFCERLIGTIRRECLDFLIPLNESHLPSLLKE
jgi:hypothetical protein